jgi:AhpD family alkylhydroperoxidase
MYNISNLAKLKRLDEHATDAMKAFWSFDKAAFAPGEIDGLNKQLIAVAVALTTQCPYCIELHVQSARKAEAQRTQCFLRRQSLLRRCALVERSLTHHISSKSSI